MINRLLLVLFIIATILCYAYSTSASLVIGCVGFTVCSTIWLCGRNYEKWHSSDIIPDDEGPCLVEFSDGRRQTSRYSHDNRMWECTENVVRWKYLEEWKS